jgi:alpha-tubulin suppressor-like RCC1 family protein/lysophospholipase L1-like esterase
MKAVRRRSSRVLPLRVVCCGVLATVAIGCFDDDPNRFGSSASLPETVLARLAPAQSPTAIAAGGDSSYATFSHVCVVAAGGLQCWGAGSAGQLGDAVLPRLSPFPTEAFPPGSGVTAVAAGAVYSCALVEGRVHCWGNNSWQQAGPSRPYVIMQPLHVERVRDKALQIAAGSEHTCAITEGGAWCWGRNGDGQTGAPACAKRVAMKKCTSDPVRVAGLEGDVRELALGRTHSCALVNGAVQCWGGNSRGQLGDGSSVSRHTPAPVAGLPGEATALVAGTNHSCAVVAGALHCWGANDHGQLGDGTTDDRSVPTAVVGLAATPVALAAGGAHTCAAMSSNVLCWGDGREGQLDGSPRAGSNPQPLSAPALPVGVTALAAGQDVSCALRSDGRVQCWGDNDFGQLGSGDAPLDHPASAGVTRWSDGQLYDRDGNGSITIACLGDSNTHSDGIAVRGWCERLGDLVPGEHWRVVNRSEGGATAVEFASLVLAVEHLEYALENDSVDAVVFAYGTNDLAMAKAKPLEIANAYSRLRQRARIAGVDVFVALTPPIQTPGGINLAVDEINRLLRSRFPADRVIDFWSGILPEDFADSVHLTDSGQEKRARAAWETLSAAAEPVVTR